MSEVAESRIYIAIFGHQMMNPEEIEKFYVYVKNNRLVADWHSPFTGTLFIKSSNSAMEIVQTLREFLDPKISILVTLLTRGGVAGFLPPETWKWMEGHGMVWDDI